MLCDLLDYLSTCSWCEAEAEDEEDEEEEEEEEEGCPFAKLSPHRRSSGLFERSPPQNFDSKGRHPHSISLHFSEKKITLDALQIISVSITKRPQNPIVVFPLEFPCRTRAFASICA